MKTEAAKKASKKYDEANTRFIGLKLNKRTDQDILKRLEDMRESGIGYQQYIKRCIRDDIPYEN